MPFGLYPVSRRSASMRSRVAGAILKPGSLLATRDIVDAWTLARMANSLSVTGISFALDIRFSWVLG